MVDHDTIFDVFSAKINCQSGKPAPPLASSHAKYPDIYRRSKPAVAKLRREAAAFGVNGIMEYKADISEARLGSAARRG
ncbi:hypothetical protein ElyMa_002854100 [Elysia marginata]|uniref:Uncharacterized protein n=1 Tax=Elysia marginata TaxID=1093978 RepID=A0AAV4HV38_9GAST|nr:hypothetical protein ElyMa_002854100 [Elysia marginata]